MRDITLGQYYTTKSPVHELDPRTKLLAMLLYVVLLFLVKSRPIWYLPLFFPLLYAFHLARIPAKFALRGLRPILLLLCFTFFFRMTLTPGEEIARFWIFSVTREGVLKAVRMTARIAFMVSTASLLAYTTTPRQLADGIEKVSAPLEKIKIPVHSMAVMLMISFRFIPVLFEEINTLMDAQAARGAEFDSNSVWKKTKYVCALPMPIFISCVRRAADLAMAIEARGYQEGAQTTRMYPLEFSPTDKKVQIVSWVFFVIFLILLQLWS